MSHLARRTSKAASHSPTAIRDRVQTTKRKKEMEDLDHCDWKLALQELFQGQDAVSKLNSCLFRMPEDEDGSPNVAREDLARMVVGSFARALSLLGYRDGTKSDGTASSCLSSTEAALLDPKPSIGGKIDGRGRYKRRKSSESWSEITPALVDDGHAWRKYGQKSIHGSDFPRSYFRCTHKFEQKCEAAKQVQQIANDPLSYRTTYYGHHTCENTTVPQQFILDGSNPEEGTVFNLVSFGGTDSSTFFSKSCKDEHAGLMGDEKGKYGP